MHLCKIYSTCGGCGGVTTDKNRLSYLDRVSFQCDISRLHYIRQGKGVVGRLGLKAFTIYLFSWVRYKASPAIVSFQAIQYNLLMRASSVCARDKVDSSFATTWENQRCTVSWEQGPNCSEFQVVQ